VRQLLADKISGNQLGLWLLVPEHLRLGTWDLLCGWTEGATPEVAPRLALQLVHEAALCVSGVRQGRSLSQKGFELANGLPFVATDQAIHDLLAAHLPAKLCAHPFTPHWAGFATTKQPFGWSKGTARSLYEIIQRSGERPEDFHYKSFLATADRPEVTDLSVNYPRRWHVEEFFKFNQALGWQRAGTLNLNLRYGHMTLALVAQAVVHQFRQRLGPPCANWDATPLAQGVFCGLEGDVRVQDDTIVVTYYNAPNVQPLREHYEQLPNKLNAQRINPQIPWLYNFKLDFRFK